MVALAHRPPARIWYIPAMRVARALRLLLVAALLAALSAVANCGSKSGLPVGLVVANPSPLFCANAEYASGSKDLGIYIVLDRSDSMKNDDKWTQASAALSAFVTDPSMAGVAVLLAYYPQGAHCDTSYFVQPAVFAKNLPADGALITASLAQQDPEGETPTRPALHGAIEFSRALMLAEPTRRMVVAVVSDGAPNLCDSTPVSVAEVALDGATSSPQVLTFAIGLRNGAVGDLELLAEKGGTGKPVLVSDGPGAGQELVDALRGLKKGLTDCRFALPPVKDASVQASDVRVAYRTEVSGALSEVAQVSGNDGCASEPYAFYSTGGTEPTHVELCPALCTLISASPESRVTVVVGCAGELDASPPPPPPDGGTCGGAVTVACVKQCGSNQFVTPVCVGENWECPAGSTSLQKCGSCAAVPHVCCLLDGTVANASCIDGAWQCPAGGTLYGTGKCKAPDVCVNTLPCAVGQYCESPNFNCGGGPLPGHCVPVPSSCSAAGPPACGCNGSTYPSACAVHQSGIDVSATASCAPPGGSFACGPLFCKVTTEICRKTTVFGGVVPLDDYACIPAPAGCATGCGCSLCPTCPQGKLCTESCSKDSSGGRVLSCNQ